MNSSNDDPETDEIIEELSNAFSSGIAPTDISSTLMCCCQQDDCQNYRAWEDMRSSLENKFTLTIGHELLQRFENLRQQHDVERQESPTAIEDGQAQISQLITEKQNLEKQVNQALVHHEVAEAALETLHKELHDAHQTIAHLTADNVMYGNLESRLLEVINERDDLQQEREATSTKTRRTELDLARLQAKITKLRGEVWRLQHELEQKELHQTDFRGSLLQSTKSQIQRLVAKLSFTRVTESTELTKSLEDMCTANDRLKRHNKELEAFLVDARDEIQLLRQEVEEKDARIPTRQNIVEHDELQETEVAVDIGIEYSSVIYEIPQQPRIATPCNAIVKFFFMVGILSYWVFCAKAIRQAILKEDDWPRIIEYVTSGTISLIFIGRAMEKQSYGSLYEAILVNVTSFIGASFCVFIGWRIAFEIRVVLALSYINHIVGLVAAHMK
ncbi:hypothetical protein C8R42DRAFT_722177 [Lentinula raphanica]|nr:hypothetical protein C8R42DRAFT_722177 [Lentinula raphanica]